MTTELKDISHKYLRKAFVNNSYNEMSTHLSLRKTWENSFSYLYALQNAYIGYEEYFIDLKKMDENIHEPNRLYFNKSYKPCFDIEKNMINICNNDEYRKSDFYKQNISFTDICDNPSIFDKMPVLIIDDHVIWDYQLYITDSYVTFILSLPSNFIFEYERNDVNDKRIYKDHKLRVLIIDNTYYQRMSIKKEGLNFTGNTITLTESIIESHLITSKTATTQSSIYKKIPENEGILFCSIHIPHNKRNYELGTMMVDMKKTDSGYVAELTDDIANTLSSTNETFYLSIFFFNRLHLHTFYTDKDYAVSVNGEANLACITKEPTIPYNMPIPIENFLIMKKTNNSGYKLIHNTENLELFYPCFYHIKDETQQDNDQYKLFYFYKEDYNLKYTCIHDFFYYCLSYSNIEHIIDGLFRNDLIINDSTNQEDIYSVLLYLLTYYSYIHHYGDIDFIYRYNNGKVNVLSDKSLEYKNETLREWAKTEPFVLRDYVLEQKKKGCSFYIFTNTIDLESRKRNDISVEFPDIDNPYTFNEPHYVFSTLNNEEMDHHLNIRVFVDGLFVTNLYQKRKQFTEYIYIPGSMINNDSFIEVEFIKGFYIDKNVTFTSLDDTKTYTIASKDQNIIPTKADFVVFDDKNTGVIHRYDPGFFDINVSNEYGEFKTAMGTTNRILKFVNMNKFTIKPNSEDILNMPLKIRLSKSSEGIRYIVPRDGEIYLEFVDNTFGYHKDFLRIYHNGRIMPREKYMFYPMYHYPRILFLDEMKKDDVIFIDISPYRYTQIYYKDDISPSEDLLDLKKILNKPFDIRYYDVYLNGRKLSINNAIPIDPWTVKLVNLHSTYNLLIFEKERDYEYYGVDYTTEQFFFSIEELFKKNFITEGEKEKILNFIIGKRKNDKLNIRENVNDEEREYYPSIGEKYIYYLFDSYYYDELMPKTFINPDIKQISLLVMLDWFKEIYDLYITSPYLITSSINEPNAKERRRKYIDCLCLNPDLQYDGEGTDNSQLVYSVGHLNEIEKSILDMEIKIKTEVTIDTTIKDELETDEELEV